MCATYTKEQYLKDYEHVPDGLEHFLEAFDNDELSDGAWWACLEEGVSAYNEVEGTDVDPNDGVHAYLARRHVQATATVESCENIECEEARQDALEDTWATVVQFRCDGGPMHYTVADPIDRTEP